MIVSGRLATFVVFAFAPILRAQSRPIPLTPVSTIMVGRDMLGWADTSADVVVVVRDVNSPDRSLEAAWIGIGPAGTDVRYHPARTAMTRADGTARLAGLDTAALDVVALRIGYVAVRFTLQRARRCRQTIEVYVSQSPSIMVDSPTTPSPTPARVVMTTCAPAG